MSRSPQSAAHARACGPAAGDAPGREALEAERVGDRLDVADDGGDRAAAVARRVAVAGAVVADQADAGRRPAVVEDTGAGRAVVDDHGEPLGSPASCRSSERPSAVSTMVVIGTAFQVLVPRESALGWCYPERFGCHETLNERPSAERSLGTAPTPEPERVAGRRGSGPSGRCRRSARSPSGARPGWQPCGSEIVPGCVLPIAAAFVKVTLPNCVSGTAPAVAARRAVRRRLGDPLGRRDVERLRHGHRLREPRVARQVLQAHRDRLPVDEHGCVDAVARPDLQRDRDRGRRHDLPPGLVGRRVAAAVARDARAELLERRRGRRRCRRARPRTRLRRCGRRRTSPSAGPRSR